MIEETQYAVFKTRWGWFGLLASQDCLIRATLPLPSKAAAKIALLSGQEITAKSDKTLFLHLQEKIIAYFEGQIVDFNTDTQLFFANLPPFTQRVLRACRNIPFGHTLTYLALAKIIDSPDSARATGNALARNPLPLIIPCHRVIRANGSLAGFSAPGGRTLKKRLLALEQSPVF